VRKEITVIIDDEGRDKDKVFVIKEMPTFQAEKWAIRALLALAKSNVEIPEDIAGLGLQGVAALGMRAFSGLSWADAEPLLDEMMTCVKIMPDPTKPQVLRAVGLGGAEDIEEVATLLRLRKEAFNLHINFSLAESVSTSEARRPPRKA
jgi:hypothetical protein